MKEDRDRCHSRAAGDGADCAGGRVDGAEAVAACVGDEKDRALPPRRRRTRIRHPTGRAELCRAAGAIVSAAVAGSGEGGDDVGGQVDAADAVVAAVGDVERAAVWRNGEALRRGSARDAGIGLQAIASHSSPTSSTTVTPATI